MDFKIRCGCGRNVPVPSSAAGSQFRCTCGQILSVPKLSELRIQAGKAPFERTTAERIGQMVADNALPDGNQCASCGTVTGEALKVLLVCERPWQRHAGIWAKIASHAFVFWEWLLSRHPEEPLGRELVVPVPLRMCAACATDLKRRQPQHEIRRILEDVPVYDELLRQYPGAVAMLDV